MYRRTFAAKLRRHSDRDGGPSGPDAAASPKADMKADALPETLQVRAEAKADPKIETKTEPKPDPKPVAAAADGPEPKQAPPGRGSRLIEGGRLRPTDIVDLAVARAKIGIAWKAARPAALPIAASALLALAIGYGIGASSRPGGVAALTISSEPREDFARLGTELAGMRLAIDGLRSERDAAEREVVARQSALVDRVERAGQDGATRLARLAEQVERLDKGQRDPARFQALAERLDRVEKGIGPSIAAVSPAASATTASLASAPPAAVTPPPKPAAADVNQTGSIEPAPAPKPDGDARRRQVDGYWVRDYDDGFALVETRSGRYVDVAVGYTLPGLGRVEAIERRGRQWVVVTPKGYIAER